MKLPLRKKRNDAKKKRAYELLEKNDKGLARSSPVIIKEKEATTEVMVNCAYCGALMKLTPTHCPSCGAPRRH